MTDWTTMVRGTIPASAEDLGITFDNVFSDFAGIPEIDIHACALAAAASSSNGGLAHEIGMNGILFKSKEREAAKSAAANFAMIDIYSTYTEALDILYNNPMSTKAFSNISSSNNGGVTELQYDMYLFSCAVSCKNTMLIKQQSQQLIQNLGMYPDQVDKIAQVATIISAFNRIVI